MRIWLSDRDDPILIGYSIVRRRSALDLQQAIAAPALAVDHVVRLHDLVTEKMDQPGEPVSGCLVTKPAFPGPEQRPEALVLHKMPFDPRQGPDNNLFFLGQGQGEKLSTVALIA